MDAILGTLASGTKFYVGIAVSIAFLVALILIVFFVYRFITKKAAAGTSTNSPYSSGFAENSSDAPCPCRS
jgi:NADH:ubiquinone oxidoreductase subunit 3 (subunit A)